MECGAARTNLLGELPQVRKEAAELQAECERLTGAQVNLNSRKQGFFLREAEPGPGRSQKKQFKNKEGYSTGEERCNI